MDASTFLDVDHVVDGLKRRFAEALSDWSTGVMRDETSLMERVGDYFSHQKWNCDSGKTQRTVNTTLSRLHRRGIGLSDKHGSDLGMTLSAPDFGFLKTVLLQFKISSDHKVELLRKQLEQATESLLAADRTFVIVLNESTGEVKVRSAKSLLAKFGTTGDSKTFDMTMWEDADIWAKKWLTNQIGPMSPLNSRDSIESNLQENVIGVRNANTLVPWSPRGSGIAGMLMPTRWIEFNVG